MRQKLVDKYIKSDRERSRLLIIISLALVSALRRRGVAPQIIFATAKVYDCFLLTADSKILNYTGVKTLN